MDNNKKKYTEYELYLAFKQFMGRGVAYHPYDEKEAKKRFKEFKDKIEGKK